MLPLQFVVVVVYLCVCLRFMLFFVLIFRMRGHFSAKKKNGKKSEDRRSKKSGEGKNSNESRGSKQSQFLLNEFPNNNN